MTEVTDGIIPAKTGVILKGTKGDYTLESATTTAETIEGNELVGLTENHPVVEADNAYILVDDAGVVKFGKAEVGTTIAAGKAYLPIASADAAKVIGMNFGETTAINTIAAEKTDGAYYTLSGVKTTAPVKGMLYIHNGKKYMAK